MTKTKVIAYCRVSTDKQGESGLSLQSQRERIEAYAKLYDLEVVRVVEEVESAKTLKRPLLQKALSDLATGQASGLLVTNLDRLTRSVVDLGDLVSGPFASGRSSLLSVGEQIDTRSAAGRLVLNVLASVSQWEREAIGERTRNAIDVLKSEGKQHSKCAPLGFSYENGLRVVNDKEQACIARAQDLRKHRLSMRAVAAQLATEGYMSRSGHEYSAMQVSRMLEVAGV